MKWIVPLLLAASSAYGGAVSVGAPGNERVVVKQAIKNHDTYICVIADTQKQTNPAEAGTLIGSVDTCIANTGCTKQCSDNPYCTTSWIDTGVTIMRNEAYALTNQRSLVDWTGMIGDETPAIVAKPGLGNYPQPRCDIILHVGDMIDLGDGGNNCFGPSLNTQIQWDRFKVMLDIIKGSGIPFLMTHGNHDDWKCMENDYLAWFRLQPYYYDDYVDSYDYNPSGTPYSQKNIATAALINTPLGRLCIVAAGNFYPHDATADVTDGAEQWYIDTEGCGGNYPTITLSHFDFFRSGTHAGTPFQTGETFASIYGHAEGPTYPYIASVATELNDPNDFFTMQCNWQSNSTPTSDTSPYGIGSRTGAGGSYCVMRISPAENSVDVFAFNPYTQSAGSAPQGSGSPANVPVRHFDLNWEARFGAMP